jgi:hypothetical protein
MKFKLSEEEELLTDQDGNNIEDANGIFLKHKIKRIYNISTTYTHADYCKYK